MAMSAIDFGRNRHIGWHSTVGSKLFQPQGCLEPARLRTKNVITCSFVGQLRKLLPQLCVWDWQRSRKQEVANATTLGNSSLVFYSLSISHTYHVSIKIHMNTNISNSTGLPSKLGYFLLDCKCNVLNSRTNCSFCAEPKWWVECCCSKKVLPWVRRGKLRWWLWAVHEIVVVVLRCVIRWVDNIETGLIQIEEGLRRMRSSCGWRRACSWEWESWWCCIWEQWWCCSCYGGPTTGLIMPFPCPGWEALMRT